MTTGRLGVSVGNDNKVNIYHLLRAAFGQRVAIAKVVDLDVLDKVAILLVDFCVEGTARGRVGGWRFGGACTGSWALQRSQYNTFDVWVLYKRLT